MENSTIKLTVIPEPTIADQKAVIKNKNPINTGFTYMQGYGKTDYLCGACSYPLCKSVDRGNIINIVFYCSKCGSYNILKGT